MIGRKNPPLEFPPIPADAPLTFDILAKAYWEDYVLQRYRSLNTARGRVDHLRAVFGGWLIEKITSDEVRNYQLLRRKRGVETSTINRETSALGRMFQLAVRRGQVDRMPIFPKRLEENPPREGFFEHAEYVKVRAHLPAPYQDVLDFAYYSGWRKQEILGLTWREIDLNGGVIRLSARRSKTKTGRLLPISPPLQVVLIRRARHGQSEHARVFHREDVPVRTWRTARRDACRHAEIPHRVLHDCRRTAARNLIRAGVPERVAMLLTGHKTRAVFDRYNIVNEQELLTAGHRLATYLGGDTLSPRPSSAVSSRRRKPVSRLA